MKFFKVANFHQTRKIIDQDDAEICTVTPWAVNKSDLLAAAPDLLDALKLCLGDDAGNLDPETVHLAMEAIAKAEGK